MGSAAQFNKAAGRRLLIVDDHPIVRSGLAQLLLAQLDIERIHEAGSAQEAIDVFRSERPHGVLVDLTLGSSSGLDLIVDLLNVDRQVPVLVVSMHDELLYAERALRAGARGYVMKHQATEHVADAVQRILSGETAFSPAVRQRLLSKVVDNRPGRAAGLGVHALSTREMEVLHLIGLGYSSAEIASALSRSVKTVESHRASIRAKLDLSTNFELIRYATRFAEPGGARTIVEDA